MKPKYTFNHFHTRKVRDRALITTDHGSWQILTQKEYDKLRKGKLQGSLLKSLIKSGAVLDKRNIDKVIGATKQKNHFLFNSPNLHIIVPTLRCDHKCLYCHSKSKPEKAKGFDMDKKTAKETINFVFQSPSKRATIEFQGGEPLLNFDIVRFIIEYTKKQNKKHKKEISFSLVTNLSSMDRDIMKYMIKNKVGLCTSLDGPKELHDKNRPFTGGSSYEKVVHWIKEIQNSNWNTNALMVTTKHSLPFWKEIVDEYAKNNLKWIKLRFLDGLGYAKNNLSQIGHSAGEYIGFWKKSVDYLVELNKKTGLGEAMVSHIMAKLNGKPTSYVDFQSPCGAAIGQLAYAQDGSIYSCDEGRCFDMFKLGHVRKDKMKGILTSDQTCSLIAASTNECLLCDACAYKPYCGVCPVCNYAETGNLIPKLASNSRCKIHKAMFDYIFEKITFSPQHKKTFDKWFKAEGN